MHVVSIPNVPESVRTYGLVMKIIIGIRLINWSWNWLFAHLQKNFGSAVYHQFLLLKILTQKPMYNQHPSHCKNYPTTIVCFRSLFISGIRTSFIYSTGKKKLQLFHPHYLLTRIIFEICRGVVQIFLLPRENDYLWYPTLTLFQLCHLIWNFLEGRLIVTTRSNDLAP